MCDASLRLTPPGLARNIAPGDVARAGLERLLRYCARPPFAMDRLKAIDAHRLIYHLSKPNRKATPT